MKLYDQIVHSIDDAVAGKFEAGLLHACTAIDATARKLYPDDKKVGRRYVNCLREYYWIMEPMISGIDLVETRFENVPLRSNPSPDLAEFIYEIFRCNHAHGDEVPPAFSVIRIERGNPSVWEIGVGELHIPDRVIWALLGVVVFSRVNADGGPIPRDYFLSLGQENFIIADWWGREDEFRPIANQHNTTRVVLKNLRNLRP